MTRGAAFGPLLSFVVLPNEDVDLGICDVDAESLFQKPLNGLDWEIEVYTSTPKL